MKKTLFIAMLSLLFITGLKAQVILQDSFNYANGILTNVSSGLWSNYSGTADSQVVNGRLEVFGTAAGGAGVRSGDVYRPFTNTLSSSIVYASFIVNATNLINTTNYFAHFSASSSVFKGKVFYRGLGVAPNSWRLGTAAGVNAGAGEVVYPLDLATNIDYRVVISYDINNILATLWVDPVVPSDASRQSNDTTPAGTPAFFSFRQSSPNDNFRVDDLFVGNAFTDVVGTTVKPPTIYYQPIPGPTTNFAGGNMTLSCVAGGAGTVTFQWQHAGTNLVDDANDAGSASNVLTLVSSITNQTGDYQCIVTSTTNSVAAGTATSSVAHVVITAAPIPPSFITQPVSQNLFTGQNMILTTSVSSPGNCTFTWYSNNTAVATTGPDNSGASTFEIDNVAPTNSATYKVAVTNDVAASGIVSSNAVVTVVNPQHVTIGFLRTLVDPATFLPTNSVTPYQVTGTVTTLTNITSGTTSSYYLQDGTAGINIFITGTSTFRPAQGAVVTFVGVLSSFTSGLELEGATTIPYTSWVDTGTTNTVPAPIAIPFTVTNNLSNLNYNIAGSLVTLANVFFGTNGGNTISTTANVTVGVTNASGQPFFVLFSSQDLDTAGQTLPAFASSVTGIMYGTSTNQLFVTRFADIVTTIAPSPIPLTMISSGGTLTFTWSDPSFNLQSSTNVLGPYATIPGASSGFMTNAAPDQPEMFFRLAHP